LKWIPRADNVVEGDGHRSTIAFAKGEDSEEEKEHILKRGKSEDCPLLKLPLPVRLVAVPYRTHHSLKIISPCGYHVSVLWQCTAPKMVMMVQSMIIHRFLYTKEHIG